jgi:hypothetical protein
MGYPNVVTWSPYPSPLPLAGCCRLRAAAAGVGNVQGGDGRPTHGRCEDPEMVQLAPKPICAPRVLVSEQLVVVASMLVKVTVCVLVLQVGEAELASCLRARDISCST